jgi:hypothetical protein
MSKATKPLPMLVDKLINVYDNKGETADRYTAVIPFDASAEFNGSKCVYFGFNESPAHPMGIGMSGEAREFIDKPSWKHLGKRILFSELPEKAQLALWSWMVHVYSPLGGK